MLYMMGTSPEQLSEELRKCKEFEELSKKTDEQKQASDTMKWTEWIHKYRARVQEMITNKTQEEKERLNKERVEVMKANNPKYVLRNYLAQNAIAKVPNNKLLRRFKYKYLLY